MATPAPRKRKAAAPPTGRTVKTSLILDAELHTKLVAAAAMRGVDQNDVVVEALTEALGGIVVFDRRKQAVHGKSEDRPSGGGEISPEGKEAAGEGPAVPVLPIATPQRPEKAARAS